MMSLTNALFRMFFRRPWTFIIMTVASIGFSYLFSAVFQSEGISQVQVPIHVEESGINSEIIDGIDQSSSYAVLWTDKEEMEEFVRSGKAELGVIMRENDFEMVVGVNSQHVTIVAQLIQKAYVDHAQASFIIDQGTLLTGMDREEMSQQFNEGMEEPFFVLESEIKDGVKANEDLAIYHALFGMTLFFVIYTIAFNVIRIIIDKSNRIWDRMILSPLKKWEMYTANIIFSFILGYVQVVLIFFVFRFVVGIPFHGQFIQALFLLIPYVFAIVALCMFITGISKSVQHYNTIITIIAISLAMIGGAFWPLEIVSSSFMIGLSKVVPITYAIDLLEGTIVYGKGFGELLYPVSVLVLMGVVFIGLGIHLIERRNI